jgi:hypothetical protein
LPQSAFLERTTIIPENLAKQGILGQIKEKKTMTKILFICHGNILTNFKFSYKIKNGRG